jgi:hypothetical protein
MSTQTILFIGSTGGCTNACLTHALLAGHRCIALVRNPDKLITKLKTDQGLSAGLISRQLTTVTGNAKSISDLKSALLASTPTTISSEQSPPLPSRALPDTIVSGLGAVGQLTWEFCKPLQIVKPDDPSLCTDGAKALMQALREIYAERPELVTEGRQKPKLVFVSTTGVTRGKEDVPAAMRFMYHQVSVGRRNCANEKDRLLMGTYRCWRRRTRTRKRWKMCFAPTAKSRMRASACF